jgi:hypothetical protein
MSPNPMRSTLFAGVVVALAVVASPAVHAAESTAKAPEAAPIVVAQAASPTAAPARQVAMPDAFPPEQRGVRKAAAESNEALRRYVWRTRMIYNFYYDDFAPKE